MLASWNGNRITFGILAFQIPCLAFFLVLLAPERPLGDECRRGGRRMAMFWQNRRKGSAASLQGPLQTLCD